MMECYILFYSILLVESTAFTITQSKIFFAFTITQFKICLCRSAKISVTLCVCQLTAIGTLKRTCSNDVCVLSASLDEILDKIGVVNFEIKKKGTKKKVHVQKGTRILHSDWWTVFSLGCTGVPFFCTVFLN
jgi:hypothetical protein